MRYKLRIISIKVLTKGYLVSTDYTDTEKADSYNTPHDAETYCASPKETGECVSDVLVTGDKE